MQLICNALSHDEGEDLKNRIKAKDFITRLDRLIDSITDEVTLCRIAIARLTDKVQLRRSRMSEDEHTTRTAIAQEFKRRLERLWEYLPRLIERLCRAAGYASEDPENIVEEYWIKGARVRMALCAFKGEVETFTSTFL